MSNEIEIKFHTIRAQVHEAADELDKLLSNRRIMFGPGFPQQHSVETTTILVNKQTFDDLKGLGHDASEQ